MQRLHYSALVAEDYDCYCFEIIVTVILVARVNTSCCLLIQSESFCVIMIILITVN